MEKFSRLSRRWRVLSTAGRRKCIPPVHADIRDFPSSSDFFVHSAPWCSILGTPPAQSRLTGRLHQGLKISASGESMNRKPRKCISCGSTDLVVGNIMNWWTLSLWQLRFIPTDMAKIRGLPVVCLACRDCGNVTQYISDEHLTKMRAKAPDSLGASLN